MANRIHLSDEIEHAPIGWAHLAADVVSGDIRRALGPLKLESMRATAVPACLPKLLEANAAGWSVIRRCRPAACRSRG